MRGMAWVSGLVLLTALGGMTPRAAPVSAQGGELYDPTVVRDYELTFDRADWEAALQAAGDAGNVPARLVVGSERLEQVGVRYKGLSSMYIQSRKKPLNLKIDAFRPGQRLLGFDVVNLNNGYSDPSFVREALMTEVLRPYMPTQRTAYARVGVNGAYLGLYLAVEQVEGTFLSAWFPGSDGILVKCDPPAGPGMGANTFHSALEWEGEDLARYRTLYEVKTAGAEEAGLVAIREAARMLDAPVSAGGTSDADLPEAASSMLDVDGALWYLAANNLFVNYDSYYFGHNYFLYLAEEDGLLHFLLWDTSLSFGALDLGTWGGNGASGSGVRVLPTAQERDEIRPVLRRLLTVPEWRADYLAHYRDLLREAFDPAQLEARGVALQTLARPGLVGDPNRLFPIEQFTRNLREDVTGRANLGPGGKAPGVLRFARERADWLRRRAELAEPDHRLASHVRVPDVPSAAESAAVTVRFDGADVPTAVRLVYRVERGAPRSIELTSGGGTWHGTIPPQEAGAEVTYYVRAALPGGRSAFHPTANQTQPWRYRVRAPDLPRASSDLVVNELMADNESTVPDEAGEHEDWVELYNRGASPIALADYYLGTSAESPWAFRLPADTLGPGDHYLVWCDKDPEQGPRHAPFKLARDGEEVRLSRRDAVVDVVTFGPQAADVSHARLPDGADAWWSCESPTPGQTNRCANASPTTPATRSATVTAPAGTATAGSTTTPPPSASPESPTSTPGAPGSATPTGTPAGPGRLYLPAARRG